MAGGAVIAGAFIAIFVTVTSFWGEHPDRQRVLVVTAIGVVVAAAAWIGFTPFVKASLVAHGLLAVFFVALSGGCLYQGCRRTR